MKKGFTLIELSIVLVIIALIIGGILAARSMIETAALNKTISQLTQFDAGVGTFRAKYNSLPGDSKWFGGDGDRAIEGTNAFTDWDNSIGLFANEIANFWAQAMPGTYAPTPYTTGSDLSFVGPAPEPPLWATSGPNRNVPAAVIGKSNTLWHVGAVSTDLGGTQSYNPSPIQNYYSITTPYYELNGFYNIHSSDDGNLTLKPIQLFSLDKKIDAQPAHTAFLALRAGGLKV